jgi:hypothetical protein
MPHLCSTRGVLVCGCGYVCVQLQFCSQQMRICWSGSRQFFPCAVDKTQTADTWRLTWQSPATLPRKYVSFPIYLRSNMGTSHRQVKLHSLPPSLSQNNSFTSISQGLMKANKEKCLTFTEYTMTVFVRKGSMFADSYIYTALYYVFSSNWISNMRSASYIFTVFALILSYLYKAARLRVQENLISGIKIFSSLRPQRRYKSL